MAELFEFPRKTGGPFGGGADNSGEPPHNDGMENRVAKLEEAVAGLPTKADFGGLRIEFEGLRSDVKTAVADLRADMHKNSIDLHKWMIGTVIGLFIGFGGLFLAMSNGLKQPHVTTPAAQQQPIIINVPAAATPAQPAK